MNWAMAKVASKAVPLFGAVAAAAPSELSDEGPLGTSVFEMSAPPRSMTRT